MDYVISYLANPVETGVYNKLFKVDFSGLEKLFRELAKQDNKKELTALAKKADSIKEGIRSREFGRIISEKLREAIEILLQDKKCPKELRRYYGGDLAEEVEIYTFSGESYVVFEGNGVPHATKLEDPLSSRRFDDIPDVVFIDKTATKKSGEFLLDVTTIKKEGSSRLEEFIKCLPHVGKAMKQLRERRTFSSRYVFRPYALAVELWLSHESASIVPKDLRDFFKGAIRYYDSAEWRTSIVLSAIAVESILADLYEEIHKKYAPNVPLGELYFQVKNEANFPKDITRAIEMVNKSRIAAVHRSRSPVSDRESLNALHGATAFTMWYFAKY